MDTKTLWTHRLSNWSCGAVTALAGVLTSGPVFAMYRAISQHSVFPIAGGVVTGLVTFIAIDFIAYWQHRLEHTVPLLWRVHEVHHQSKLCDTSVSFRTSALAPLTVLTPHLVLAVAGVPFATYFAAYAVHAALMFCLHSRTPAWLDRAGWLFNSPYLHRGHHSARAGLRNRNFGGVFILWDRLFGTFEADCETNEFGLPSRPTPLSAWAANLAPFRR